MIASLLRELTLLFTSARLKNYYCQDRDHVSIKKSDEKNTYRALLLEKIWRRAKGLSHNLFYISYTYLLRFFA